MTTQTEFDTLADFDSYTKVDRTQSDPIGLQSNTLFSKGTDPSTWVERGLNPTRHVTSRANDGGLGKEIKFG
jgi:hypothetical protein